MTAADLRVMADLLDRLAAAGFAVALEVGGDLIIRATPPGSTTQGEPFSDGTRFTDGTGWVEQASESSGT
jgi:predicted ATPase